ncbi:Concanavalin A-like lectin/glucanases superfamily protein [Mucilaginibacter pineti]|uniref:Concanavalin A-like lectin/glucanases superfamily protein n=1 Tax=Mucilaginibacter pineti TaxID=1391627 RepID=A0A1G7DUQ1_9SPHI|nr:LamG domain-containing protein [Mucilaginibacter pineti]SDE55178.1 Concanavalin A-like lectin/glucanases superfamily protein [Mucilaginibacter pineti]
MKKLYISMVIAAVAGMGLSSCQKSYDPKSYAPKLDIGGFTSSNDVAKGSLVGYWNFNGNLKDSISNSEGVATGTKFTDAGIKGQALQGALDSYVLATPGAGITGLQSFTVTEWINTAPPTVGIIGVFSLAKTDAFWGNIDVFIENNSTVDAAKVRIHIYGGGDDRTFATDGVANLLGKWANLGFSYDAGTSTCKLYVNGSKVATAKVDNLTGPLAFNHVGKIVFGCVQFQTTPSQTTATGKQDWASFLTGQLDEVRVYNKALTDAEVNAIVKLEGRKK